MTRNAHLLSLAVLGVALLAIPNNAGIAKDLTRETTQHTFEKVCHRRIPVISSRSILNRSWKLACAAAKYLVGDAAASAAEDAIKKRKPKPRDSAR